MINGTHKQASFRANKILAGSRLQPRIGIYMVMKLIRKKAPRGALKRWLSEDEETAVQNIFGLKRARGPHDMSLASKVIIEMRESEVWLQCSCVTGDTP